MKFIHKSLQREYYLKNEREIENYDNTADYNAMHIMTSRIMNSTQ